MNEGWRDFGEVKKLLEEGRQGKTETDVELFLAEVDDIVRLLLNRGRFVVYQEYEDVVQNAKTLSELPFR